MQELEDNNRHILEQFNCFKEKFYSLETDYDRSLAQLKQEKQQLADSFEKQKSAENEKEQQLLQKCDELQQKLQVSLQEFTKLNKLHLETVHNLETMKTNFEKLTNDFERYKHQVNEENSKKEQNIKVPKLK